MEKKMLQTRGILILLFSLVMKGSEGQDTICLSVQKAEEIFLKNNLSLLAAQYNIHSQEELIRQAKAWDNPVLNTDQNLYDGKFFRHSKETDAIPQSGGQIYLSLQQVIRTANKRGLQVQMAQDAVAGSEAQFRELMRSLKYVLHTDLNNLSQLQRTAQLYESEITHMQQLVRGMEEMYRLGDISLKDNVRIKALLYSLQSDYADNLRQQQDLQREIKNMLQLNASSFISVHADLPKLSVVQNIAVGALLDSAEASRPDVLLAQTQAQWQLHNISLQKAISVPDLTVGLEYDKANSYVPNYYGLQLSLPLPILNKNRGNINAAQRTYKQAQVNKQQVQSTVRNEVIAAYNKLYTLVNMQKNNGTEWQENYDKLLTNMLESYRQRKVSLVEFIDFFDSYKDVKSKQYQQQTNLLNAIAELNYVANQNVITNK